MPRILYKDVTVASGGSVSAAFDTDDRELVGVVMSDSLTGGTLHVETSDSVNGTFTDHYVNGTQSSYSTAASRTHQFNPPIVTKAARFDTGGSEAAARTLKAILRSFE